MNINSEEYRFIEGGITAPAEFVISGVNIDGKDDIEKNNLGLVFSKSPCVAACICSENKAENFSQRLTKENLKNHKAQALLFNCNSSNVMNENGYDDIKSVTGELAKALDIPASDIIANSSGPLFVPLNAEAVTAMLPKLVDDLFYDKISEAANAMSQNSDCVYESAVEFTVSGVISKVGVLANPENPAFFIITSDISIEPCLLEKALIKAKESTVDCARLSDIKSAGDIMVIMASGMAGNDKVIHQNRDYEIFLNAVSLCLYDILEQMTSFMSVCMGAPDEDVALEIAKAVSKNALSTEDIITCLGTADYETDFSKLVLKAADKENIVTLFENGVPTESDGKLDICKIFIDLGDGDDAAIYYVR